MYEVMVLICDWCKSRGVDDNFFPESGWIAERKVLAEGWQLVTGLERGQYSSQRFLDNHYAHKDLRVELRQVHV